MSFFEDASLVLIPSAIKDQKVYSVKPTDGTGDLTFSRASDATRVASNGLIEKVRENLCLNSQNQLGSNWLSPLSPTTATVTASTTTDPYGGTNAFKVAYGTGVQLATIIAATVGTTYTASIWVRKVSGSDEFKIFDTNNAATNFSITTDWQRFSLTSTANSAAGRFYIQIFNSSSEIEVFGAQLEVSDFGATDYIATTTTAVSVGPVSGLPRLDYLNSSCPRLLLEPQRTNLITFSEQINDASWSKAVSGSGIAPVVTANYGISPSGYQDADRVQFNAVGTTASDRSLLRKLITLSATQHALSFYVKSNSGTATLAFTFNGGSVGTITATESAWTRVEYVGTGTGTLSTYGIELTGNTTSATADILFWGAQLEEGAYATSYIPTLSTSVTRVADAASKTGISSLIGQTEGTLFMDVNLYARDSFTYFALAPNLGSTSAYIGIAISTGVFSFEVANSGIQVASNFSNSSTGNFKIAFAYKANDFVAYVNGVQVMTDTSGTVPACSQIGLNNYDKDQPLLYNQALLFKTRLTNAQLSELTA
jgi:hypothetical protein